MANDSNSSGIVSTSNSEIEKLKEELQKKQTLYNSIIGTDGILAKIKILKDDLNDSIAELNVAGEKGKLAEMYDKNGSAKGTKGQNGYYISDAVSKIKLLKTKLENVYESAEGQRIEYEALKGKTETEIKDLETKIKQMSTII